MTANVVTGLRELMRLLFRPLWRWQVVRYGTPDQVVQWQDGDQRVMVVPPGEYQVTMQPVYGASERVVWPQNVRIVPGQQVTFRLDSGGRMIVPSGASPDFEF